MLHIYILGRFSVEAEGRPGALAEGGKVQSLLCYLLVHRDHSHSRELLASRFWDDATTTASKKHLRQALWQLQTALGDQALPAPARVLLVEPDWVRINPEASIWLDTLIFERAYASVQDRPGESFDDVQAEEIRQALALYRGDLLEGCYDDWCLYERERLQNMMLMLLDKLMGHCEARHRYELGIEYGERILRYDHASERTYRRLMRLHYLNGDRTAALRQYERCRHALRAELSLDPAAPTTRLHEQIRADQIDSVQPPIPFVHTAVPLPPASPARQAIGSQYAPLDAPRGEPPTGAEQAARGPDINAQLETSLLALQQQVSSTLHVLRNARTPNR
jgi:DNA-binding SARP family transcriptional activator